MSRNTELFSGGMPTGPDVDALMRAVDPKPGETYLHDDLAAIIGVDRHDQKGEHRYRTVVNAWRKRLFREKGVDFRVEKQVGYYVLQDHERVSEGIKDWKSSTRRLKKAGNRIGLANTENLDETQRAQKQHAERLILAQVQAAEDGRRQVASAGKVTPLPRPPVDTKGK